MLVFTRKVGEAIVIGEDIAVTIVRVGPNDVRIGIEAPEATSIERDNLAAGRDESAQVARSRPREIPPCQFKNLGDCPNTVRHVI